MCHRQRARWAGHGHAMLYAKVGAESPLCRPRQMDGRPADSALLTGLLDCRFGLPHLAATQHLALHLLAARPHVALHHLAQKPHLALPHLAEEPHLALPHLAAEFHLGPCLI